MFLYVISIYGGQLLRQCNISCLWFSHDVSCYANVGKMGGGQIVNLGYNCLGNGTIIHEILHVLGMWHEHTRMDRDDYISVIMENIYPGEYISVLYSVYFLYPLSVYISFVYFYISGIIENIYPGEYIQILSTCSLLFIYFMSTFTYYLLTV